MDTRRYYESAQILVNALDAACLPRKTISSRQSSSPSPATSTSATPPSLTSQEPPGRRQPQSQRDPITSLPENLQVGGNLYLNGTPITSLPENLQVGGNLYLSDTPITSLPENLQVGGDLNLTGTLIKMISPELRSRIKGRIIGL
jgi:hypothetical protein